MADLVGAQTTARNGNASIDAALVRVIDALPDAILLLDESWRIVYANQTARVVSHIQPENLNRETLWELYPEIVGTNLERACREAVATGTERAVDAFYYEPFKTWFDVRIVPMERGVTVHYRDVTAVREAEAARDAAAAQLQEVFDATTDSVLSLDRDWRITYINQRAREVFAPRGDVLGTNLWESFPHAVYEGSPFVEHSYRAMNDGVAGEFDAYYPGPLNVWVHVIARPARDGIIVFFRDVTEQKQKEDALRASEHRARLALDCGQFGNWDLDLRTQRATRSLRHDQIFGYEQLLPDWTYEQFLEHVEPQDREYVDRAFRQTMAEGRDWEFEARIRRADGAARWIWAKGQHFLDEQGTPIHMVGVVADITDRKLAEEALRASEQRYRVLTELNPQALWTADVQGRVLYANQRFLEYIGKDFVPKDGTEYLQCFYEDDRERVLRVWSHSVATGEDYVIDARLVRASDGAVRWWHLRALPLRDDAGVIEQWLGTAMDVHDNRMTGERLREQYALVESSRDFIGISSLQGTPIYGNRAALQLVGIDSLADFTRVHIKDFFFPEDQDFILNQCFPQVLREGHCEVEIRLRHFKSGEPIWMNYHVFLLRDAGGEPVAYATVSRDVTAQKRTEAALMQTEKLAAVGRLASSIAHEINNPLESVTNLIYLARQAAVSPEAQRYLDTADQELRRVAIIANQTLRFHKQATKPRAMECADLFSSVLSIYEGRLRNSNIRVEERKRAKQPVVCFEGEIRQVLNNLVGNAIDAMPTGGRLLVRSREATDWRTGRRGMVMTVADTGSGIDRKTQAKMFEAFFTTKEIGGTGLGLWVSAEIMNRHQGRIRIRSSQQERHRGTVVRLFLPFQTMLTKERPLAAQ